MGLMDVIRKAEEQSRRAARRGMEKARATWNQTERRLRRRMRVNRPEQNGTADAASRWQSPALFSSGDGEASEPASQPPRARIISIHGKDVRKEDVRREEKEGEDIRDQRRSA